MIRYALTCHENHAFESWFKDSAAFEDQAAAGLVACPACGSTQVSRALMTPAIGRRDRSEPTPAEPAAPDQGALLRAAVRKLRAAMLEGAENVGERFAEEARAIHDGDAPARLIHGQTSHSEAAELIADGVPILPLPDLPDDKN